MSDVPVNLDNTEWVMMTHPEIKDGQPARTTQEAFDTVWAEKGWVVQKPPTKTATEKKV